MSWYDVLGLSGLCTQDQVEKAFMEPANRIHALYESDPKLFEQDTVKFKPVDSKPDDSYCCGN